MDLSFFSKTGGTPTLPEEGPKIAINSKPGLAIAAPAVVTI
jgi:hypothetical protein